MWHIDRCMYMSSIVPGKRPLPQFYYFHFFEVFHVIAHRAKFLRSEPKVGLLSSFWCSSGATTSSSKVSHTNIHSLVCSVSCLQHKICILQATNMVETWQQSYGSVCLLAQYIFPHCRTGLNEAWVKQRCRSIWHPLAASFSSGWALARG